jgi:hypothetical protein
MTDLSQQVLETIEKEQIKPWPRYAIFLRRSVFWTFTVFALVIGGIAVSVTIFSIANAEWDLLQKNMGGWKYFLLAVPYVWLVLFAGFVALAHFNLRHTKFGYRFSVLKAITVYLVVTIFAGSLMYRLGAGANIEELIAESNSYYHYLPGTRFIWSQPENGMLGGQIREIGEGRAFILVDQGGHEWQVTVSGTFSGQFEFPGAKIKMVGARIGTSSFQAVEIRSWCGCGGCEQQVAPACAHATATCGGGSGCGCGE